MSQEKNTDEVFSATVTAPVNIAVIKYWGKRDTALNLPTNSSFSVTLSQDDLCTRTTASCSRSYAHDSLELNDAPCPLSARYLACLAELRALRRALEQADPTLPELAALPLRIASRNNFPTASGLASSASGFAALVRAVADLYALPASPTELSRIARVGSGSASRSLFGGYAGWARGQRADGADSEAYAAFPASHWPEMRMLVLVTRDRKKDVSSTAGMQVTVATSDLFWHRADKIVPERMRRMEEAVRDRDFAAFGALAMRDSNSFHALCLDSVPPIFYMDDASRAAVAVVGRINEAAGEVVAAYSFDAGPNAVIFYLHGNRNRVAGVFRSILGETPGWDGERGKKIEPSVLDINEGTVSTLQSRVKRVILTAVGEGPVSVEVKGPNGVAGSKH
ncbi:Diphosphomevalonate decarboxylase [Botryosphaeria dothidea]|uniref:Diphosphomevalonate decarboxylase n=1 Tax=Botryosphaeria dothidea TaxID=55169 RepID=A0A8H4J5C6_9PEZI|nr:Diphosphomevalonate decarboxylase [Botryosphaeria dothidea]